MFRLPTDNRCTRENGCPIHRERGKGTLTRASSGSCLDRCSVAGSRRARYFGHRPKHGTWVGGAQSVVIVVVAAAVKARPLPRVNLTDYAAPSRPLQQVPHEPRVLMTGGGRDGTGRWRRRVLRERVYYIEEKEKVLLRARARTFPRLPVIGKPGRPVTQVCSVRVFPRNTTVKKIHNRVRTRRPCTRIKL